MASEIRYFHREKNQIMTENVAGESAIRFIYENPLGAFLRKSVLTQKWVSQVYGYYQSTRASAAAIDSFIEKFSIDMSEYESRNFESFNDFFIRSFLPGKRTFVSDPNILPAFAEGRYFGFEAVHEAQPLPVKNVQISIDRLLGAEKHKKEFEGGPVLIARLCPVDYHRFHFPDSGTVSREHLIEGPLESVNPIALSHDPKILFKNERQVSILETKNFGRLAYIEVGALCVGRIVQSYSRFHSFERGQEKGYFLFGGSTVILLGTPGSFKPSDDILAHTREGLETFVKLGDNVAHRV